MFYSNTTCMCEMACLCLMCCYTIYFLCMRCAQKILSTFSYTFYVECNIPGYVVTLRSIIYCYCSIPIYYVYTMACCMLFDIYMYCFMNTRCAQNLTQFFLHFFVLLQCIYAVLSVRRLLYVLSTS